MKQIIVIIALVFLTSSCQKILDSATSTNESSIKASDLKVHKVNNKYTISVPDYMKEMKSLHDEASFEYANIFKETYAVVIDEDKSEFIEVFKNIDMYDEDKSALENYIDIQLQMFEENINDFKYEQVTEVQKINNIPANQYMVFGNVDNINVGYLVTFFEGENDMYFVMTWTLKDRYKTYKRTFKLIADSFKTL